MNDIFVYPLQNSKEYKDIINCINNKGSLLINGLLAVQKPHIVYSMYRDLNRQTIFITNSDLEAKKVYDNLINENVDATHITAKDTEYNGGICVLTSALAKGLEFDAVIINDASSNTYDITNKTDMHLLYVALTRALHEQIIMYDKNITKPLEDEIQKNMVLKKV